MRNTVAQNRWYLSVLVVALVASQVTASAASAWSADKAHTEINFSIKHFFTPVTGSFDEYEIDLDYNPEEPEKSSVEARIKVASIDTGNSMRDEHLRAADWFEADQYPYITFKSTAVRQVSDNQVIASGPLTIKGKSQQIELAITLLGKQAIPEQMQQMLGGTKEVASFQASTTIDRGDFGVGVGNWAATVVVGGEVSIEILLEAHRK